MVQCGVVKVGSELVVIRVGAAVVFAWWVSRLELLVVKNVKASRSSECVLARECQCGKSKLGPSRATRLLAFLEVRQECKEKERRGTSPHCVG